MAMPKIPQLTPTSTVTSPLVSAASAAVMVKVSTVGTSATSNRPSTPAPLVKSSRTLSPDDRAWAESVTVTVVPLCE